MTEPLHRTRRVEALAAAPADRLLPLAERALAASDGEADPGRPPLRAVHPPEVGTVTMTVREPVERTRFLLADVLVTRCEIEHRATRAWAMRIGDDREATLAAAILDAETEAGGPLAADVEALCRAVHHRQAADRSAEWDELAPTVVSFEEMN
ncbi:MAG: phosphonate C-P lyase system protein PhnG [Actinomycetota bacterium]